MTMNRALNLGISVVTTRALAALVTPQRPTPVCITHRDDVPTHCPAGTIRRTQSAILRAIQQAQNPRSA